MSTPPAAAASLALKRQLSWSWLAKRCFIVHAGKVLAVTCLAAAMQLPSALGLLLVLLVSLAALLPLPKARSNRPATTRRTGAGNSDRAARGTKAAGGRHLASIAVAALQLLVALWLLVEYALQLPWLRQVLLDAGPPLLPQLLTWLGLPMLELQPPPAPAPAAGRVPGVRQRTAAVGGGSGSGVEPWLPPDAGYNLEVLLRWKVLMIMAGSLWFRARR